MNQRGFANIILVLIIVVLAGAVGYFAFVKKTEPIVQQPTLTPTKTTTPTKTSVSPTPTPKDKAADWKNSPDIGVLQKHSQYCDAICYFKRGNVNVIFRDGLEKEGAEAVIRKLGYSIEKELWLIKSFVVAVPFGKEQEAIGRFRVEPMVREAEYNYVKEFQLK